MAKKVVVRDTASVVVDLVRRALNALISGSSTNEALLIAAISDLKTLTAAAADFPAFKTAVGASAPITAAAAATVTAIDTVEYTLNYPVGPLPPTKA